MHHIHFLIIQLIYINVEYYFADLTAAKEFVL